jgi:8-oxo-dGTP pyrophosphatase MutT (NUDIX family)
MQNNQDLSLKQINEIRKNELRPVVVGCFINEKKLLIVYSEKYKLWFLPQGGIENNETIPAAIKREMIEELGADFINKTQQDYIYLGENQIDFPKQQHGNRELFTDQGEKKVMKGKKYLFYVIKAKTQAIDIAETEFDKYQWVNYEQGMNFVEKIYQERKKRITLDALDLLKNNNFIN